LQLTEEGFNKVLEGLKDFETGVTLPTSFNAADGERNTAARALEIQKDPTRKLLSGMIHAESTAK
jgi:branched-chain amino acid transport system substrate-binding protein